MNLALKDVRYSLTRFVLTILGVSLLMAATIGMLGMYRGIVFEALVIIDGMGTDLWVVEGGRAGPFAEPSTVPTSLDRRVQGVQGVASARRFVSFNQQFTVQGRTLRLAVVGLDMPQDGGDWIDLIAGRALRAQHYEAIADRTTGLELGQQIVLNNDTYRIVGISARQVDMAGDGMLFTTIPDAQRIGYLLPSEAVILNRQSKGHDWMGGTQGTGLSAVAVTLQPGADMARVRAAIERWGDVQVLSRDDQHEILLEGRLGKLRVQILSFTTMTLLICCAVIALTIYTMTVEKAAQIALLKLIGARDRMIGGMILTQALIIGLCSFAVAVIISFCLYPHFPRTVLILPSDLAALFGALLALSAVASWFAIGKATRIRAQEVLA
jgi:putative ABC transport system permease protein